jgi:hypothetical protein
MDAIREQFKKPLVIGLAALVVGILIGLVVLGWWLWPVKYTGAGPKDLRADQKAEYLRMAVTAYSADRDALTAQARYNALGEGADDIMAQIIVEPNGVPLEAIQSFSMAVGAQPGVPGQPEQPALTPQPGAVVPGAQTPGFLTTPTPQGEKAPSLISRLLPILCALVVLILIGGAGFFYIQRRGGMANVLPSRSGGGRASGGRSTPVYGQPVAYPAGDDQPYAQFTFNYQFGDDLFDESGPIETPSGEFLGECGMSISEALGSDEPKRVTAFEVWLFNNGQRETITKVLMSGYAFDDEATHTRLSLKGEPVLASPGQDVSLLTNSLQMTARIVDMAYGDGGMPDESYFERFIVQLTVWPSA